MKELPFVKNKNTLFKLLPSLFEGKGNEMEEGRRGGKRQNYEMKLDKRIFKKASSREVNSQSLDPSI